MGSVQISRGDFVKFKVSCSIVNNLLLHSCVVVVVVCDAINSQYQAPQNMLAEVLFAPVLGWAAIGGKISVTVPDVINLAHSSLYTVLLRVDPGGAKLT